MDQGSPFLLTFIRSDVRGTGWVLGRVNWDRGRVGSAGFLQRGSFPWPILRAHRQDREGPAPAVWGGQTPQRAMREGEVCSSPLPTFPARPGQSWDLLCVAKSPRP